MSLLELLLPRELPLKVVKKKSTVLSVDEVLT
jgi:hypothetical protein